MFWLCTRCEAEWPFNESEPRFLERRKGETDRRAKTRTNRVGAMSFQTSAGFHPWRISILGSGRSTASLRPFLNDVVLQAFGQQDRLGPSFRNEQSSIVTTEIEDVAHLTIAQVDPVNSVGEFAYQTHRHCVVVSLS